MLSMAHLGLRLKPQPIPGAEARLIFCGLVPGGLKATLPGLKVRG